MLFAPLKDHPASISDADLVLVEGEIPAATSPHERLLIAPYHVHHSDDECFYVLSGQLAFEVGDHTYIANAGDAVLVPHGAVHTWWNPDTTPARYLIAMPRRLNELIIALHSRQRTVPELENLFRQHDATYIGWTR